MGHLEGNFTPVLYIGRKVPRGKNAVDCSHADRITYNLLPGRLYLSYVEKCNVFKREVKTVSGALVDICSNKVITTLIYYDIYVRDFKSKY